MKKGILILLILIFLSLHIVSAEWININGKNIHIEKNSIVNITLNNITYSIHTKSNTITYVPDIDTPNIVALNVTVPTYEFIGGGGGGGPVYYEGRLYDYNKEMYKDYIKDKKIHDLEDYIFKLKISLVILIILACAYIIYLRYILSLRSGGTK